MTGPAVDNLANAVSMEEMEAELAADKPTGTPKDLKLEGDNVPEADRGKELSAILEERNRLESALRISEDARLALRNSAQAPPPAPTPVAPVDDYKFATREELEALHQENPLAAVERMNNDAMVRAERHFEQRFGRIEGSVSQSMESWARQQFPDEFEILGSDISALVAQIPNKAVFNTKQGWQDAVDYVRGKNFEKMYEFKANGKKPKNSQTAREEQQADVGFSPRPTTRSNIAAVDPELDSVTLKVAEELGLTPAEYKKWQRMGR